MYHCKQSSKVNVADVDVDGIYSNIHWWYPISDDNLFDQHNDVNENIKRVAHDDFNNSQYSNSHYGYLCLTRLIRG